MTVVLNIQMSRFVYAVQMLKYQFPPQEDEF